ncbi:MAG: hypothetical protein ACLUQN_00625 [Megasphaera sp.]
MRTFHTGGVASAGDITQGLPRVEELFEARKPKGNAIVTEISGTVSITEKEDHHDINIVHVLSKDGEERSYTIPFGSHLVVHEGDVIEKGSRITAGSINPTISCVSRASKQHSATWYTKYRRYTNHRVLVSTISTSKSSFARCCAR